MKHPAVRIAHERNQFYKEIDGFYVFDTDKGYLSSHALRALADELDAMNRSWEDQLDEYFDKIPADMNEEDYGTGC